MTLEKRIQLCNELTPAEQQLANYILKNRSQLETVTISQLAQLTAIRNHTCIPGPKRSTYRS